MLSKKHVLISGCNGGIGIEILKLLVKNGAKISISYHKNRDQIDNFLDKNKENTENIQVYQADLTNDNDLDAMLNSVLKDQPVDIFIHLPTHPYVHKDLMKTTWDDIQNHINLQAKSFFNISKQLVPDMKLKKHGVLVNILTSYVVGKPPSGVSDYVIGNESGPICLAASFKKEVHSIYLPIHTKPESKIISNKTIYYNTEKESDETITIKIMNTLIKKIL